METRTAQPNKFDTSFNPFSNVESDESVKQRLDYLLKINAETAREKSLYKDDREKLEAQLMKNPLGIEKAYGYLGLMLGAFPPFAIFTKWAYQTNLFTRDEGAVFLFLLFVNFVTAITGYFTGKFFGKAFKEAEKLSWTKMILTVPFIGLIWGIMSGGAGGFFIFVIGAFFGAFIGGAVGAAAALVFTIFHRLLKNGDFIEVKHFLPLAFGMIFTICAFVFGL